VDFEEFWPWWARNSPSEMGDGGTAAEMAEVAHVAKAMRSMPLEQERQAAESAAARLGLGRIVALHCRSSALHQNCYHIRCISS
jgi:hypothetical protein